PPGTELLRSDDGRSPILAAFEGEDCSGHAARCGLDFRRLVGIDPLADPARRVTIMTAPAADPAVPAAVAAAIAATGRAVTPLADSPGFVAQRILATIVNLAAEIAQLGIAAPEDIDRGVTLGL